MEISQAEALLKHLGFTEYEAKAYLTLTNHGTLNAEKISKLGFIPLPRVYDTMKGLSDRGLIFVSRTRPQTFRAVNTKQLVDLLREDEKKKMDRRIEKIETTVSQLLKITPIEPAKNGIDTEEVIATVKRKINMEKLWFMYLSDAKHDMLIFAGDLSWVDKTSQEIKKSIKNGIKYKVLWCRSGEKVIKRVKKLMKLGIELRYIDTGEIRGAIIDNKKVSLVQTGSSETDITTIILINKLVTDIFRSYFFHLWKEGKTPEKFFKDSR